MIVLDTNVLSEPLKSRPDERVLTWLRSLREPCGVTSVSVGELLTGVRALPAGRRRDGLLESIESTLSTFAGAVLPYDEPAARTYARLQERRRATGRPLAVEDGMIAAICTSRGTTLATRNIADFAELDLELIDPWSAPH
ncbi:MAG: type II toxin-antitoxin system VapC family toxin [Nitriliruptor sp.]